MGRRKKEPQKSSLRDIPVLGWLFIITLFAFPAVLVVFFIRGDQSLLLRLWLYTVFLLPGLALSFNFGITGALVSIIFALPVLVWQTIQFMKGRLESSLILVSHLTTLMLVLFLTGVASEAFKRQRDMLEKYSFTDPLTNLYNQRFFYNYLEREMDRSRRYNQPLSLVLLDLDDFKIYNDTYGHVQGDRALIKVADILRSTARATDVVARYGGEEFAVILPQTNLESAKAFCERLREKLAATPIPAERGATTPPLTASLGVALYDGKMTAREFVHEADKVMYFSKRSGKNLVTTENGS